MNLDGNARHAHCGLKSEEINSSELLKIIREQIQRYTDLKPLAPDRVEFIALSLIFHMKNRKRPLKISNKRVLRGATLFFFFDMGISIYAGASPSIIATALMTTLFTFQCQGLIHNTILHHRLYPSQLSVTSKTSKTMRRDLQDRFMGKGKAEIVTWPHLTLSQDGLYVLSENTLKTFKDDAVALPP